LAGKRKIIVTDANEITIDREFLEKLTLYLEEISQRYISNDDIREKRACWINSVYLMMELLNELGNDHGPTRRMLLELIDVFLDLNAGRRVGVLEPEAGSLQQIKRSRGGDPLAKSTTSFTQARDLGSLCAFIDLYIAAGLGRMIAAGRVAQVANRVGVCLPARRRQSKGSDAHRLLNWRTEFGRGRDRSDKFFMARKARIRMKEMHRQLRQQDPDATAEAVVDRLLKQVWIKDMGTKVYLPR
jgi:hypothetical protein